MKIHHCLKSVFAVFLALVVVLCAVPAPAQAKSSAAIQEELNALHPRMDHIGYLNVRRRIELYYGPSYTTHIEALDKGTRVTLRIRYAVEDEHVPDHDC